MGDSRLSGHTSFSVRVLCMNATTSSILLGSNYYLNNNISFKYLNHSTPLLPQHTHLDMRAELLGAPALAPSAAWAPSAAPSACLALQREEKRGLLVCAFAGGAWIAKKGMKEPPSFSQPTHSSFLGGWSFSLVPFSALSPFPFLSFLSSPLAFLSFLSSLPFLSFLSAARCDETVEEGLGVERTTHEPEWVSWSFGQQLLNEFFAAIASQTHLYPC
jgi:hypothetical protein